MKARELKRLLNNTGYTIGDWGDYIAVGSPMCHNLIKVEKKGFKMTYALSISHPTAHRADLRNEKLLLIWDKLAELIKDGTLQSIIDGVDHIENPLPVYTVKDGQLLFSQTDAYGWPNTTKEGVVMHNNEWFDNPVDAVRRGILDNKDFMRSLRDQLKDLRDKSKEKRRRLCELKQQNIHLKSLLP